MQFLNRKKKDYDVHQYRQVFLQGGMIVTLAALVGLFNIELRLGEPADWSVPEMEKIQMEHVELTDQTKKPPPPQKPQVPVPVADDALIEDELLDFDTELELGDQFDLGDPPATGDGEPDDESSTVVIAEIQPRIKGGIKALYDKLKYPAVAREVGIQGRVVIQFVVNKKGEIVDPVVVRDPGGGLAEEALRALKEIEFYPGLQRGRPVNARFALPVVFKLKN